MHSFHAASQTIARALATREIGTPVAVRIVAHSTADHGTLERLAARSLAAAAGWLESRPDRLAAFGSVEAGQVSTLARFAAGQSALVSVGSCGVGPPLVEIVVWGNRGILAWEGGDRFALVTAADKEQALSDEDRRLLEVMRASLRWGRAVPFGRSEADRGPDPEAAPAPRPRGRPAPRSSPPKPQPPPYGILLVAGDHTHQPGYAESLLADKRCRLVGLADEADATPRRRELNQQLARKLGIPLLADLRQALARADVHIVSICAEPERRGRIIVAAAQAGKHLYLDKPLAGTLADADAIVAAVQPSGVVSHMFSQVRTDAAVRVRELAVSGALGDLTALHFDVSFAKGLAGTARLGAPRRETPLPDRFELADSKRELTNIGVYPLVMLFWLLGSSVRRVCAATGNYFFAEHQQNDMEDFGMMLLELDGGVASTIAVGRTGWRSHPGGGLNRTYLAGTKQTALVDAHRPRVEVWADVEPWTAPKRNPDDPMSMWGAPESGPFAARPKQSWITPPGAAAGADAAYFLDCVEQGRASDVSAAVAAAATEVLLAAYQSAATGQVVSLPLARRPDA